MRIRGWAVSERVAALVVVGALTVVMPLMAAQKDKDKDQAKVDKARQEEGTALATLTNAVIGGQPAPADVPLTVSLDFLKAQEGHAYVPYTVSFDASKLSSKSVALYMRMVKRGPAATPGAAPAADAKKDKEQARPEFPWETVYLIDLTAPGDPGQPIRVSRAMTVLPGDYDMYVAIKDRGQKSGSNAPKMGFLKEPVTVPDFWNSDLSTSSIILAKQIEPLSAPLPRDQQVDHPYTLGTMQMMPAFDPKFSKKDELNVYFQVYNAKIDDTSKKPDVVLEYSFMQKTDAGEKYFNRTAPQNLNAQTLPPQFDVMAGYQLVGGQSVPLASFPPADYRLDIKITDKLANKTVTRSVAFTVLPS